MLQCNIQLHDKMLLSTTMGNLLQYLAFLKYDDDLNYLHRNH
jgi:hypothetical protein